MKDNNDFLAYSKHAQEVKKLALLMRNIKSNILIYGEHGVGKSYLARFILPEAALVDGAIAGDVKNALSQTDEIIIDNIERVNDIRLFENESKRIIGISQHSLKSDMADKIFGMTIHLLPLSERPEDIEPLTERFYAEALEMFKGIHCPLNSLTRDISHNAHSLKASVYRSFVLSTLTTEELSEGMEKYFYKNILPDDGYREFLKTFDTALINAYFRHFKSQLMMASKMGINRNTLRKKISELGMTFDDE